MAWVSSNPPCRAARVPIASRSTSVSSRSSPRCVAARHDDRPAALENHRADGPALRLPMSGDVAALCLGAVPARPTSMAGRAAHTAVPVGLGLADEALGCVLRGCCWHGCLVRCPWGSAECSGGHAGGLAGVAGGACVVRGGRWLPGMRERVTTLGGLFDAGPDRAGGFMVTARVPVSPPHPASQAPE